MNAIIEIAGYVLLATVLFGAIIAFFLMRAYWYQPSAVAPHPEHLKLPSEATNAVRKALEDARRRLAASSGTAQEALAREVLRLEARLEQIDQKTYSEQRDYHYAIKLREGAWLQWKELHDRASLLGKRLPPDMRDMLKAAEQNYLKSHHKVEEERHTAVARDMVNLEEIRGQKVLTQAEEEEPEFEDVPAATPQEDKGGT
jgi:uncharacterized membrane protein